MNTTPMLPISERFVSIQGEGMLAGVPSSFIRTQGCNLRCAWCDEPETSWGPGTSTQTSVADIVAWAKRGPQHVVLTGGEPLLHREIIDLTAALQVAGHHVTIETAGTITLEGLRANLISISPKLQHSTPRGLQLARHERRRLVVDAVRDLIVTHPSAWQLRFVVRAGVDADVRECLWVMSALGELPDSPLSRVFLTPEGVDPAQHLEDLRTLATVCMAHGFRLGHRLHLSLFGHVRGT